MAVAALGMAAPATAKSRSAPGGSAAPGGMEAGGGSSTGRPIITGVSCLSRCAASASSSLLRPVSVREDATVKVRGRNMGGVGSVVFLGGPGRGDDVTANPSGVGQLSVDVEVPSRAASGPVLLIASSLVSPPSRQRLVILDGGGDDGDDGDGDKGKNKDGGNGDNRDSGDNGGNGGGGGGGPVAGQPLIWPVPKGPIYGAFGENRGSHVHAGIDIASKVGTPIVAAASGNVLFAGASGAYGNYVCVAHSSVTTCYAHLAAVLVSTGTSVSRGQQLGTVGMTGNSSGPHLHFEVRQGTLMYGLPLDPGRFLPGGVPAAVRTNPSASRAALRVIHRHHQD